MNTLLSEAGQTRPLHVVQFICPTGFFGAERWITALANNTECGIVRHSLAVTDEPGQDTLALRTAFESLDLNSHPLPMTSRFDPLVVSRLVTLLRRERVDVLHTHGYKSDLIGIVAAKLAGAVAICTPHGFENTRDRKLRAFIALGNRSFRYFDAVVPLSEALSADVRSMGVPEGRLHCITNGVDIKAIDATLARSRALGERASSRATANGKTVGFVGQLIGRKNVDQIINALSELRTSMPELRLALIGDGPERATLERHTADAKLAGVVSFLGYVDDPLPYYDDFDVFVMTSALEGIPRCLMESMAAGVPIVAYAIPGVVDLIEDDVTGLLVPYGDEPALSDAISRVIDEPELAARLTAAARARVEGQFSASRMAGEYVNLYRSLVAPVSKA